MRTVKSYQIPNIENFKSQLLTWSQQFKEVVWLDSNNSNQERSSYDVILAVDANTNLLTSYQNAFDQLKAYQTQINDWIFGYLSYDLKNDLEDLISENVDGLEFSDMFFFQPKKLFLIKGNVVEIH